MISIAGGWLLLATQTNARPDRLDLAERLLRLDRAWMSTRSPEVKQTAISPISRAVTSFFSLNYREACAAIEQAETALTKKARQTGNLRYRPQALLMDQEEDLVISKVQIFPDLIPPKAETPETKTRRLNDLVKEESDRYQTSIRMVTKVPSLYVLLDRFQSSRNPDVRAWTNRMRSFTKFGTPEVEENISAEWKQYLKVARATQQLDLSDPFQLWYGEESGTRFHVRWPRGNADTVVIALHGAGGSPAMFVKSYGSGIVAKEATQRGFIFMSPDATATAINDCVRWLEKHQIKVNRLILVGHSMGGGIVASYKQRPVSAMMLFAPASIRIDPIHANIPIYMASGKQELPQLLASVDAIQKQCKNWPKFQYEQVDPCEHLMIVAERARAGFKFLDSKLKN